MAALARPERIHGFHQSQVRERLAALVYSHRTLAQSAHVVERNLELAAAAGAVRTVHLFPLPPGDPKGELPEGEFVLASPLAGFRIPYVNQFSLGFQHELPLKSKIDISYVGSRTKQMQTSRPFNNYDLAFRQRCNLLEGGNPAFCDERLPNPFLGLEPFRGTALFSSPTLTRASLAAPFPHFGSLTEVMRNDGAIWYNSLQLSLETRMKDGLNMIATYTVAKMIERNGWLDVQQNIMQQGLHQWDKPTRFTLGAVYQLPFGTGKPWLNSSHPFFGRLVSGWQVTTLLVADSAIPWALPGNVLYLKDAQLDKVDWSQPLVRGVQPCVARMNDNGTITMQPYSVQYGCTGYNFLVTPRFAPRFTPFYDGRLRIHMRPTADISLNKTTRINEKMQVQFRAEAFNAFNSYVMYRQQFVNNPDSANFGTIDKASASITNTTTPRALQFAVKFLW